MNASEIQTYLEIGGILFGSGGLGAYIFTNIKKKYKQYQENKTEKTINDIAKVYDILNKFMYDVSADNVLISYVSNGGGIPQPGKELKFTVLYEVSSELGCQIRPDIQNIICDNALVSDISEILNEKIIYGNINDSKKGFKTNFLLSKGFNYAVRSEICKNFDRYFILTGLWENESKVPNEEILKSKTKIAADNIAFYLKG